MTAAIDLPTIAPSERLHRSPSASRCRLEGAGWNDQTRQALQGLISRGSGRALPVVLDFDNTIVCGDIGEATLAVLARRGILTPAKVPPMLCPPFRAPGGKWVRMAGCAAVTEYDEALLAAGAHFEGGPALMASGYAWAVEVMAGLRPAQIVAATRAACEGPAMIEVTPGTTGYAAPFFYPEMIELIAELARLRFEIWIVSASNVWSVRWMVLEALNPRLREHGLRRGLRSDHVIGISCLLQDSRGGLHQDGRLAREHQGYAALDEQVLGRFHLTSRLQLPVPTHSGKVAAILDALGPQPIPGGWGQPRGPSDAVGE